MNRRMRVAALAVAVVTGGQALAASRVYSVPACEERAAAGYAVTVDGAAAPVQAVRHSAMPVNIRWPGHQRELDQTEIDGLVRFVLDGKAKVVVTAPRDFREVKIRPLSRNVRPQVEGRTIAFELTRPGAYSVELDGIHENLHVFAETPPDYRVDKSMKTRYYGPGEHDAGVIELKTGETLFIDEGAVVFGRVHARDADHIRTLGRGILDMSRIREQPVAIDPKLAEEQKRKGFAITNVKRWDAIRLEFCDDVKIDGIVIRDSLCYNIRPIGCRGLEIGHVKIIGNWRYNSDGIDMHNCENVHIHDCFLRTFDDAICVKGFDYRMNEADMLHDGHLHNVFTNALVERCTVWCDWGRSLEFGAETRAEEIRDITFRDCDLVRCTHVACDVQNCDYADIHDVLFDDIRVELDSFPQADTYSPSAKDFDPKREGWGPSVFGSTIHVIAEYSKDGTRRGRNRDITVRNLRVTGPKVPRVWLNGHDAEHRSSNIVFDGVYWNGREASDEVRARMSVGKFADPPRFLRPLGDDFASPPQTARPLAWWHWIGYNVSSNGIVRDLTAMKESGLGGATCFTIDSQSGPWCGTPMENQFDPQLSYWNDRWWGYLRLAAETARSLGLELGMHNCAGFSCSGGQWISPADAIKRLVWTSCAEGETPPEPSHGPLGWYREIGTTTFGGRTYRFGFAAVDSRPSPAPRDVEPRMLECDKMAAGSVKLHLDTVLGALKERLGPLVGTSFRHWLNDSYEAAEGQWTETFREDFRKACGYDPLPYLPVFAGAKMTDGERFLEDHARVVADLHRRHHYDQTQARLRAAGLDYQLEPYGGPFDPWEAAAAAECPMVEFWATRFPWQMDYAQFGGNSHIPLAAGRAAGRRIFPAEAFTGYPTLTRWDESPRDFKMSGDAAFACGVNRLSVHHWTHQPFDPKFKPGNSMGFWGAHLGENQTWYEHGKAWIAYLSRCQALLQRGEMVVDQLALRDSPDWAEFDAVADSDFLGLKALANGDVQLPSGRTYRLVRLSRKDGGAVDRAVARKVKELADAGAAVWAPKRFARAKGLRDKAAADTEVKRIAAELWDRPRARFFTGSVETACAALKLKPGFEVLGENDVTRPTVGCHRRDGETDLFFVANLSSNAVRRTLAFRVAGKVPEIWNPETGARQSLAFWREAEGRTVLVRELGPNESLFVVFRRAGKPAAKAPTEAKERAMVVAGQWTVSFEPGRGAPTWEVPLERLQSLSEFDLPGIRYFSGLATYRKILPFNDYRSIDLDDGTTCDGKAFKKGAKRYLLDLGRVEVTAEVIVNGKSCGTVWHRPYVVDVTDAIDASEGALENEIVIKVANTWRNRLIGDHREPDDCEWGVGNERAGDNVGRPLRRIPDFVLKNTPRPSPNRICFATWDYFGLNSPLVPSGLIGPVRLIARQAAEVVSQPPCRASEPRNRGL